MFHKKNPVNTKLAEELADLRKKLSDHIATDEKSAHGNAAKPVWETDAGLMMVDEEGMKARHDLRSKAGGAHHVIDAVDIHLLTDRYNFCREVQNLLAERDSVNESILKKLTGKYTRALEGIGSKEKKIHDMIISDDIEMTELKKK